MMKRFFGKCFYLGHQDPIKERRGKHLHMICPECCADLGKVLPHQKFKARKQSTLLKFGKRKTA